MTEGLLFAAGVVASLAASWLLVSRLERLGERAGFSEAWLGLVAALAADAPEITSAVTAPAAWWPAGSPSTAGWCCWAGCRGCGWPPSPC